MYDRIHVVLTLGREPGVLAIHLYASSQNGDGCVGWGWTTVAAELELKCRSGVVYRSVAADCELWVASGRKRSKVVESLNGSVKSRTESTVPLGRRRAAVETDRGSRGMVG